MPSLDSTVQLTETLWGELISALASGLNSVVALGVIGTIGDRMWMVAHSCFRQILWILLPLFLFAVAFHLIEEIVQRRLVERFGWKAALWTGWIGTPIHESSHAILCKVFGHRIDAMALFEPDSREGRLGYVRHSYQRGNWWQEAGNFFIGLAPLVGGTLALITLTWLMYPELVRHFWETSGELAEVSRNAQTVSLPSAIATPPTIGSSSSLTMWNLVESTGYAFGQVFSLKNLTTWRLWLFLYLTLCITSHMAPSGSDYQGAKKGAILLGIAWLTLNLLYGALSMSIDAWTAVFAPLWQLVFSMLTLAIALGAIVSAIVYLLTMAWDQILRTFYR